MAKRGVYNPAAEERHKQKQREIKKGREQRQQQKLERLKNMDPSRLQRRISELELKREKNNGKLGQEERVLEGLKKDLEAVRKMRGDVGQTAKNEERAESVRSDKPLGIKSIFYHPEWNPKGEAPMNLENVQYPLDDPEVLKVDREVSQIPLPSSPPPKFYKINVQPIEKEAEVQHEKLIPSTVRKRKINQVE